MTTTREGRRSGPSRTLVLPQTLTVKYLSELINQSPVDVIKQLMRNGIMVSMNQVIDPRSGRPGYGRLWHPHPGSPSR